MALLLIAGNSVIAADNKKENKKQAAKTECSKADCKDKKDCKDKTKCPKPCNPSCNK